MKYEVIKTIPHSKGWSVCFRQWRAESHCQYLHGYALQIALTFGSDSLDARNWVIDFGGFKSLFDGLAKDFDHKLVIAIDDPLSNYFLQLEALGGAEIVQLPNVGCEAFAEVIALYTIYWMKLHAIRTDVRLLSVEVREHEGNGAIFRCA
jgi:6-pyruvoyltetrahydropterin/6-carboxytetrahydropterin synthase